MVLKSRLGPQIRILRNHCGAGRRSIALRLHGVESNRDAIGARIEANGRVQYLSAGSGFLSQHSKRIHCGLGEADTAQVTHHMALGTEAAIRQSARGYVL